MHVCMDTHGCHTFKLLVDEIVWKQDWTCPDAKGVILFIRAVLPGLQPATTPVPASRKVCQSNSVVVSWLQQHHGELPLQLTSFMSQTADSKPLAAEQISVCMLCMAATGPLGRHSCYDCPAWA